jgi:hypothetical protein
VPGYSGTPLLKKLGIKSDHTLWPIGAPTHYLKILGDLPAGVRVMSKASGTVDVVHFFTADCDELRSSLPKLMRRIPQDGVIWVSWLKKSSGVPSTVTEDTVRAIALPLGLVDIKVCAVDEVWSGLKLVIRRENRKQI